MASKTEEELRRVLDRSLDLTDQYRRERDGFRDDLKRVRRQVAELEQHLLKEQNRHTLSTDTVLRQVLATEKMALALTQMAKSVEVLSQRLLAPPPNLSPEVSRLVDMCQVSYADAQEALRQMDFFAAVEFFRNRRKVDAALAVSTTTRAAVAAANVKLPKPRTKVTKLLSPLAASVAERLRERKA